MLYIYEAVYFSLVCTEDVVGGCFLHEVSSAQPAGTSD